MKDRKSILIFGVGTLQQSIIQRAKLMGLFTVGIDPLEEAVCRDEVDVFEVVGGQDYEGTCSVIEKYNINAIVTAATDKPLVMMARVAKKYGFPFFSVEAAQWSTDKFQMKQRFMECGIPCAKGRLVHSADEVQDFEYPAIVKPRDNSGSRGVKLCLNREELADAIAEALPYSHLDTVLVEEFIEGKEYSIESLHHDGKHEVIQFTEKKTTEFPYSVELGHIQPADIPKENKQRVREIISAIGHTLRFENCASHTELKINQRGIFVIETSPRLGGDYITSTLTPLSTGVNMEDELLSVSLGRVVNPRPKTVQYAGVRFFAFKEGSVIGHVPNEHFIKEWPHVIDFSFNLNKGETVHRITSSLNRYGQLILVAGNKESIEDAFEKYEKAIKESCYEN